jgi:hypothetical protein
MKLKIVAYPSSLPVSPHEPLVKLFVKHFFKNSLASLKELLVKMFSKKNSFSSEAELW